MDRASRNKLKASLAKKRQQHGLTEAAPSPELARAERQASEGVIDTLPTPVVDLPLNPLDTTGCPPSPIQTVAAPKERPPKYPKRDNSPTGRDRRMKGRFPDGTYISCVYGSGQWVIQAKTPDGFSSPATGPGIHGCIEALWDQYCRWKAEQSGSGS